MNEIGAVTRARQKEQRTAARERTAAATAGRMRASEERGAAKLEGRGWTCFPPELREEAQALLAQLKQRGPR